MTDLEATLELGDTVYVAAIDPMKKTKRTKSASTYSRSLFCLVEAHSLLSLKFILGLKR